MFFEFKSSSGNFGTALHASMCADRQLQFKLLDFILHGANLFQQMPDGINAFNINLQVIMEMDVSVHFRELRYMDKPFLLNISEHDNTQIFQ